MKVIVVFQKEAYEAAELKAVFSDDPDGEAQAQTMVEELTFSRKTAFGDVATEGKAFRVPMGVCLLDVFYSSESLF